MWVCKINAGKWPPHLDEELAIVCNKVSLVTVLTIKYSCYCNVLYIVVGSIVLLDHNVYIAVGRVHWVRNDCCQNNS